MMRMKDEATFERVARCGLAIHSIGPRLLGISPLRSLPGSSNSSRVTPSSWKYRRTPYDKVLAVYLRSHRLFPFNQNYEVDVKLEPFFGRFGTVFSNSPSLVRFRAALGFSGILPEMQRAQLQTLTKQAALFYGSFWLNVAMLSYTHYGIAPDGLVLGMIGLATPLCIWRSIVYHRRKEQTLSADEAIRRLGLLNRFVRWIMIATACWALTLSHYGDGTAHMQIMCFIVLQALSSIFGLLHIPATALQAAIPFVVAAFYFLVFGGEAVRAVAFVFIVMSVITVRLSMVYYDVFLSRVLQHDQLKKLGDDNLRLANTDLLTNLPNRRNFLQRLETEIAAPHAELPTIHLALVDLDGFKPVNDTYGHPAGDCVLKEVGRRLRVFETSCAVARLGGDEFGIILYGSRGAAERVAEGIGASLRRPYLLPQGYVNVGATLGIANAGDAKGDLVQLLENADYALYEGKAAGRNKVVTFDLSHETARRHRSRLEQTMRDADLQEELTLQFQPIVCTVSGKPVMFEALARWRSPVLGIVPPQDFIMAAEASDLIFRLTEILFGKALAAATRWPSEIGLSFNLSAQDLVNPHTTRLVSDGLRASGLEPHRLTLELTESALIRDFAKAQATLQALKALGVHLAIDDFGTGYSSLAYVHRLPIDKLKIDRSFICDIDESAACRAIVKSIIGLCQSQGLDCVAEGVETESQRLVLADLECGLLQGYGPGRPMWEAEIAAFVARFAEASAVPRRQRLAAFEAPLQPAFG